MKTIFASSNSLEGLQQCITKFYAGEPKELKQEGAIWAVYGTKGKLSTFVSRKGKRYIFGV